MNDDEIMARAKDAAQLAIYSDYIQRGVNCNDSGCEQCQRGLAEIAVEAAAPILTEQMRGEVAARREEAAHWRLEYQAMEAEVRRLEGMLWQDRP